MKAAREILDAVPDPPSTPDERLARRLWLTSAAELIPLKEMAHKHLMNLPGFIARRLNDAHYASAYVVDQEKHRARIVRWEAWAAAVQDEIERRRAGLEWMLGYGPSPELNLEVALNAAAENKRRLSALDNYRSVDAALALEAGR